MSRELIITEQGAYPYLAIADQGFLKQCVFDVYSASEPRGQKRKRTYGAVRVMHRPTDQTIVVV